MFDPPNVVVFTQECQDFRSAGFSLTVNELPRSPLREERRRSKTTEYRYGTEHLYREVRDEYGSIVEEKRILLSTVT